MNNEPHAAPAPQIPAPQLPATPPRAVVAPSHAIATRGSFSDPICDLRAPHLSLAERITREFTRFAVSTTNEKQQLAIVPEFRTIDERSFDALEIRPLLDNIAKSGDTFMSNVRREHNKMVRGWDESRTVKSLGLKSLQARMMDLEQDPEIVVARQTAFKELGENHDFATKISRSIAAFNQFYDNLLINRKFWTEASQYRAIVRSFDRFAQSLERLPEPNSLYLKAITEQLNAFLSTETANLLAGPLRLVDGRLTAKNRVPEHRKDHEVVTHRPNVPFGLIATGITAACGAASIASIKFSVGPQSGIPAFVCMALAMATPLFSMGLKAHRDAELFTRPFIEHLKESRELKELFVGMSTLEEMMMMRDWYRGISPSYHREFPTILRDQELHTFRGQGLGHPLWCAQGKNIVPNDLEVTERDRLLLITGPNSAGKTSLIKTAAMFQMLGQCGYPVFAHGAQLSLADRVVFIGPDRNSLQDEEGQFGMELTGLFDAWRRIGPHSVAFLDEVLRGTDTKGRLETLKPALLALTETGETVFVPTHELETALELVAKQRAVGIEGEYLNDRPTHRFIPGVARSSRSELVVKRVGFPPKEEDLDEFFAKHGKRRIVPGPTSS